MTTGQKLADLSNGDLARLMIGLGITGVTESLGREAIAEKYNAYLNAIYDTAGAAAVSSWLAANA